MIQAAVETMGLNLEVVRDALRAAHVARAWLFGSYARGNPTPDSDVDILVEFPEKHCYSLMDLAGLELELRECLGKPVHVVTLPEIHDRYRASVNTNRIPIYEQTF
jgi:uncharacterized protein